MRRAALAALALLASCAKCSGGGPDAGPPLVRRSTDLRTAVLTAYPEFRETRLLSGEALLRRTFEGAAVDLARDARAAFKANGYLEQQQPGAARTLVATKDGFRLEVEPRTGGAEARLALPLKEGDAARLLSAPISLTTEQLALYFPRPEGLRPARERFEVTLEYAAFPDRTHFLVWQLVDLSTRASWKLLRTPEGFEVARKEDGGIGAVPENVELTLEDAATAARVSVSRQGPRVRLEYQLDTLAPEAPKL